MSSDKTCFTVVSLNQGSQPITKMRIFAAKLMHSPKLCCVAGFRGILYGRILVPRCCKCFRCTCGCNKKAPTCYFCVEFLDTSVNLCMFRMLTLVSLNLEAKQLRMSLPKLNWNREAIPAEIPPLKRNIIFPKKGSGCFVSSMA